MALDVFLYQAQNFIALKTLRFKCHIKILIGVRHWAKPRTQSWLLELTSKSSMVIKNVIGFVRSVETLLIGNDSVTFVFQVVHATKI